MSRVVALLLLGWSLSGPGITSMRQRDRAPKLDIRIPNPWEVMHAKERTRLRELESDLIEELEEFYDEDPPSSDPPERLPGREGDGVGNHHPREGVPDQYSRGPSDSDLLEAHPEL